MFHFLFYNEFLKNVVLYFYFLYLENINIFSNYNRGIFHIHNINKYYCNHYTDNLDSYILMYQQNKLAIHYYNYELVFLYNYRQYDYSHFYFHNFSSKIFSGLFLSISFINSLFGELSFSIINCLCNVEYFRMKATTSLRKSRLSSFPDLICSSNK